MSKIVNVLSLFGGIECGRVAIERLGWNVGEYFSSEYDPYPVQISSDNYPDIIHIGDVEKVRYSEGYLKYMFPKLEGGGEGLGVYKTEIDIIIGGPPCQDLSRAKVNGKGLEGEKSSLFYEFVRILREVKPKYFLMENVASMKQKEKDIITNTLREVYPDLECHMIDSSLVSAQNRKRLYWTNIPEMTQPQDKKIYIKDIIEDIPMDDPSWIKIPEKYLAGNGIVRIREATKKGYTDCHPGEIVDMSQENSKTRRGRRKTTKLPTLVTGSGLFLIGVARDRKDERLRIPQDQEKLPTLRSVMGTGGNNVPLLIREDLYWRPLTPIECERAQTLPDDYTKAVSKTRRLKAIGNGWTVDIIKHILSHCKF